MRVSVQSLQAPASGARVVRLRFVHRVFSRRRYVGAAAGAFAIVVLLASAYVNTGHDAFTPIPGATLRPPSGRYWFGTDGSGLDVFTRTMRAARTDIPVALVGSILSMLIGVPIGLAASRRGRVSGLIMRLVDVWQSLPLLIVTLAIVALSGATPASLVLALSLVNVPLFIRLVRAEAVVVRSRRYVEAAEACGASPLRVAFRHVLPNTTNVIFAQLSLSAAFAILVIAALGFLGAGVNPPAASWGALVQEGSQYIATGEWWVALFPSLAILVAVVSFNLLADGLYQLTTPGRKR